MPTQNKVIDPLTHNSQSHYKSWIRKIGTHTYRFRTMTRSDGQWSIQVDVSQGKQQGWFCVHLWNNHNWS